MSCSSCVGSCTCSSVSIPVGPAGTNGTNGTSVTVATVTGGVTLTGANGTVTVLNGTNGTNGAAGTTAAKYANEFTVVGLVPLYITIAKAAIISCNPLITCSAFTGTDADFMINVYYKSGTQYKSVTHNTSYVSDITYDTAASTLTLTIAASGTYRVVLFG